MRRFRSPVSVFIYNFSVTYIIIFNNDQAKKWQKLYMKMVILNRAKRGVTNYYRVGESFWGVVECRNRVLWTQGVKEMCFKTYLKEKVTLSTKL